MPLTHYSLDKFVAPKLSLLTTCGMPQIEFPEVPFGAVILNQIFARPRPPKQIRLLTNMFRWMDAAFVGYAGARESLSTYTIVPRGKLRDYYRAVLRIEQCLAATDHAGVLAHDLFGLAGKQYYEQCDGSPRERLRELYVASKHIDGKIRQRGGLRDDATLPIWLTNEGIESKNYTLYFNELAGFMEHFVALLHQEFPPTT